VAHKWLCAAYRDSAAAAGHVDFSAMGLHFMAYRVRRFDLPQDGFSEPAARRGSFV